MSEQNTPMMSLGQLAHFLRLPLDSSLDSLEVNRISTDSRRIEKGDVFIALEGEQFNGHDYVSQALHKGAVCALVNEHWVPPADLSSACLLKVQDTLISLGQLAHVWRKKINPFVIALTGSNGKTTVKEMMASIMRAHALQIGYEDNAVLATEGNLNNAIGVPLTLLALRSHHRFAVVEMGMNHTGEIAYLSKIAQPDIALINTVQRAHIGLLGSIEAIAQAKSEIFVGLDKEGVAVYPTDLSTSSILAQAANPYRQLTFAMGAAADITGAIKGEDLTVSGFGETLSVRLHIPGRHNRDNALAVTAACFAAGVRASEIIHGLESFSGVPGRLQAQFSALGALVIDDTYNANPDSVYAAINVLSEREGRKILVLGDLGELGQFAQELHQEIGLRAKESGIDNLYVVGQLTHYSVASFGVNAHHYESVEEIIAVLKPQLNSETTVLVKGSRFMQMERVVKGLMQ
ncbi:UDP-N-acetylmuramoyl-tripeptide--D-alanyl-D-alanine ligase [Ferrovum sp. JA12]|uniref:UDP-N-acetylmuramoyl-tripeptide--D-alanyl-D- alanine ligase n=1 Tax=Ferrovum sp. JA12 TaxID=1356299 RepID=UPI0007157FE8|nr:UDP-N-acetylmuramoyl-tripeptide--D-alanyl-D-alanine ligase [Ferrovum sp. JA12]KRH79789.1 UDP-N-acetylmuramoyl-tripeptide--D-alanyl-D-alanine ligase [Ferrovum sp. JA12]HQT80696.1 UDP-N-acetylmuramoyl-tripeptide--D-alanyl-D-alanine ligase [Ferrovaceae bacterium]HQU05906.1 UDP-N-acetylmuramoyl-tripeptide--D-alanyl-D-alanine ligase [Ferrovaceae bacterium]